MQTLFSGIVSFVSGRKKTAAFIGAAILLGGGYWWYATSRPPAYTTVSAERRDVSLDVFVTGTVKPARDAALSFDSSGRVGAVFAKVGDRVSAGKTLATLESAQSDLYARSLRAEANVSAEEAKLAEMRRGARPEELSVAEAKADKARAAIAYEKTALTSALSDAYIKTDDAIRNKGDQMFSNPRTTSAFLNLPATDTQAKINVETGRVSLESSLTAWQARGVETDPGAAHATMRTALSFLDTLAGIVNALSANSSLSQATIDAYKSAILSGRTNVQAAESALAAAEEAYNDAALASRLADADLALVKAGASEEAISAQEARVSGAKADLSAAAADLAKASIRAPFAGLVTKVDVERGESVGAGNPVITLLGDGSFEIEARVPETDITHVVVGKTARVALDAYGKGEQFSAAVFSVDPAETVVEGVPTYVVRLTLDDPKRLARSGMTADVTIAVEKRAAVVAVPSRAIKTEGGEKTILVLGANGIAESRGVTAGLRGSDGFTEIVSGLSEGERVVTGETKK